MKRFALLACAGLVALAPGFARADEPITGSILVGNPGTQFGGVSETAAPCLPGDDLDGIDGAWVELPEDAGGKVLTVTATDDMAALQDLDVYFYGAGCEYMADTALNAEGSGVAETGEVPAEATFAIVDLFTGANATFSLTLS